MSDASTIKELRKSKDSKDSGFNKLIDESVEKIKHENDIVERVTSKGIHVYEKLDKQNPLDMVRLLKEEIQVKCDLYCDEDGESWAFFPKSKSIKIDSLEFRDYVRNTLNDLRCERYLEALVKSIDSKARNSQRLKLCVRVADDENGDWHIDKTDAVEILIPNYSDSSVPSVTARDSSVTAPENGVCRLSRDSVTAETAKNAISNTQQERYKAKPLFRRSSDALNFETKPCDISGINLIAKQINCDSDDVTLLKCILPAILVPGIQKPIFLIRGAQGTGKSSLGRAIINLVDPAINMLDGVPLPKQEKDLYLMAKNNMLVFIDNANRIEKDMQDACCRLVTGCSVQERLLFTNKDMSKLKVQAGVIINAISLNNLQSDFLERSIMIDTASLSDKKPESMIARYRKDDSPLIRYALVQILTKAREIYPTIQPSIPFRLYDFAKWGLACALAQGIDQDEFLRILKSKTSMQADETLDQSPIARPIIRFSEINKQWTGTAAELLTALNRQEFGKVMDREGREEIIIDYKAMPKSWPNDHARLGTMLSYIAKTLEQQDIRITKTRDRYGRYINISNSCVSGDNKILSQPSHCHTIDDKKRDSTKSNAVTAVTQQNLVTSEDIDF